VRYWLPTLVGAITLACVFALRLQDPAAITQVRNLAFDIYQRVQPRPYQEAGVRVVAIDEAALKAHGQWPWPRTVMARLVERLDGMGAAAIAFDVVFAEPDRTAPDRLLTAWQGAGVGPDARQLLRTLPDPDAVFAQAVAAAPVVTGFAPRAGRSAADGGGPAAGDGAAAEIPRPAGFAFSGSDPAPFVATYPTATANLPAIAGAAAGNGSFAVRNDPDNLVRRVPLVQRVGERLYPSLTAEALRVAQGASTHVIKTSTGSGQAGWAGATGLTAIKIGRIVVPVTASGQVMLHDTGPVARRTVSAADVLADAPPPALANRIRGHIVLIGASAVGLRDIRATPLDPAASGVSVHAQALEQMILGHHLHRPDWAPGLEVLSLLLLGGVLILLLPRLGAVWCAGLGFVVVAGGVAGSWFVFDQHRLLLDPVYPSLAALLVYLTTSGTLFVQTERQRQFVRHAFARYLSPELVAQLAARPRDLALGGENRELTMLFSDIRGFTGVAEAMSPDELTRFMNGYLTPMTEEVLARAGFVDKYMGDAIMAFWNAPVRVDDHPLAACRCALAMRRRLLDLNAAWIAAYAAAGRPFPEVAIGVGLHTGIACVGNMGSENRFNYSALGDNVNLASRLEGQCKTYGVDVVASEDTLAACEDAFATLEIDLVRVKGRQEPVRIHTVVGESADLEPAGFYDFAADHTAMIAAYRSQAWDRAEAALDRCDRALADAPYWLPAGCVLTGVYSLYRTRIARLRADPPPPDWDAVFDAETK
jgi:adenylate cyclase